MFLNSDANQKQDTEHERLQTRKADEEARVAGLLAAYNEIIADRDVALDDDDFWELDNAARATEVFLEEARANLAVTAAAFNVVDLARTTRINADNAAYIQARFASVRSARAGAAASLQSAWSDANGLV
jgi:hypothetical protein